METSKRVADDPIALFNSLLAFVEKLAVDILERHGLPTDPLDLQWGHYQDRIDALARAGKPLPLQAMGLLVVIQRMRDSLPDEVVHLPGMLAAIHYLAELADSDILRRSTMQRLRGMTGLTPKTAEERQQIEQELEDAVVHEVSAGIKKMYIGVGPTSAEIEQEIDAFPSCVLDIIDVAIEGRLDIVPRRAYDRVRDHERRHARRRAFEIPLEQETADLPDAKTKPPTEHLELAQGLARLREAMRTATSKRRERLRIGLRAELSDEPMKLLRLATA